LITNLGPRKILVDYKVFGSDILEKGAIVPPGTLIDVNLHLTKDIVICEVPEDLE
jgi:hypothetical protein